VDVCWLEEKWTSYEGMDEQDLKIYQLCILFTKQLRCDVPMQQI
jgi:hypothetical protein